MRNIILLTLFISSISLGASFDCKLNNLNKVERLTCENSELSKLDDIVSALYNEVKTPKAITHFYKSENEFIKISQINWIKEKNNCDNVTCLTKSYQNRIHDLSMLIKQHSYYESKKYILDIFSSDFGLSINDFDNMEVELVLHYRLSNKVSTYLAHVHGSRNRLGFCGGSGASYILYFVVDEKTGKLSEKKNLTTDECHGEYVLYTETYYNSYENKIVVGYQTEERKIPAFQIRIDRDDNIEFVRQNNPPVILHREKEQQY